MSAENQCVPNDDVGKPPTLAGATVGYRPTPVIVISIMHYTVYM